MSGSGDDLEGTAEADAAGVDGSDADDDAFDWFGAEAEERFSADRDAPSPDARISRGMEALQAAAGEMIAAARSVLDVAEDLVNDPHTAESVVEALGSMARAAARFAPSTTASADDEGPDDDDDDDGGVRRIPVS